MEKTRGDCMVVKHKYFDTIEEIQTTDIINLPEEDIRWSTVSLSEVLQRNTRFEASVFDIEGKHAWEVINNSKHPTIHLCGENSFIEEAFYPARFKRIYVKQSKDAIPFYLPSQMNEIYPKPNKYISETTNVDLNSLRSPKNTILLTRSGTVGNCTYVSKTLVDKVFSDDVIRIKSFNYNDAGYIYAFLKTNIGQTLIKTNNYGAVIQHIEPKHLENVPVPDPPAILKQQIHDLIIKSYDLRDESNEILDEAEKLLIQELKLPPLEELKPSYFEKKKDFRNYQIKLSELNNRFDASYHVPIADSILSYIQNNVKEITNIGDERISSKVLLPGRFKRIYVEEGQGTVFFGGKQIHELDPSIKKYLSTSLHSERIAQELKLRENMILITRSGTIGKINIVPKHWENWVINEHVIRILPSNKDIAGYIFCWLNSDYGFELIKKFTYGSVVNEIDANHVSQIKIPLLKNSEIQARINTLVLEANKKRYEAYVLEQKAIKMVNEKIIYSKE